MELAVPAEGGVGSRRRRPLTLTATPTQGLAALPSPTDHHLRKRPRVGAEKSAVLEWNDAMVEALMRLRFETFLSKFRAATKSSAARAAWLELAAELSEQVGLRISSDQCKSKIKRMRRKWNAYCAAYDALSDDEDEQHVQEPPYLDLMDRYWNTDDGVAVLHPEQDQESPSSKTRSTSRRRPPPTAEAVAVARESRAWQEEQRTQHAEEMALKRKELRIREEELRLRRAELLEQKEARQQQFALLQEQLRSSQEQLQRMSSLLADAIKHT